MKKVLIDCGSGTKTSVPLTEEEIEQRLTEEAEWKATSNERHNQEVAQNLATTDGWLARITEDLIDLLAAKGIIKQEELPAAAVNKMVQRTITRNELIK